MNDKHGIFDSIMGAFVPIHPDGYKFVFGAALVTLLLFAVAPPLGWLAAIATAWCAYFFRDPERVTTTRKGARHQRCRRQGCRNNRGRAAPRA